MLCRKQNFSFDRSYHADDTNNKHGDKFRYGYDKHDADYHRHDDDDIHVNDAYEYAASRLWVISRCQENPLFSEDHIHHRYYVHDNHRDVDYDYAYDNHASKQ